MPSIRNSWSPSEAGVGVVQGALTHERSENESEKPVKDLAQKSARSVVEWYPPMVVARHPEVQAVLGVMIPPLGKVMAIGRTVYKTGKALYERIFFD